MAKELPEARLEPKRLPEFERKISAVERSKLGHVSNVAAGSNSISIPLPDGYTVDDVEWLRVEFKGKTALILSLRQG